MKHWEAIRVPVKATLREAIQKIDEVGVQMCLITAENGKLTGVLTDGDVRRAILKGLNLEISVLEVMNPSPITVSPTTSNEEILSLMRKKMIHQIPIVNDQGVLVDLITLDDLVGVIERPNWVVLMAGGLGTRLRPLTEDCPKPMLKVGGKPILETILERFSEQGFKQIFISVNYKAEMIKEYFGDGTSWGVKIQYLNENTRLGTAGALSLLPEKPKAPMVVMNGDLLTRANFDGLVKFHEEHQSVATMAVREYDLQVPYGVVEVDNYRIHNIEEKPVHRFFVNAGIYSLSPDALEQVPNDTFIDMPHLYSQLMQQEKNVIAYPLREYWIDIGKLEDFRRANGDYIEQFGMLESTYDK